MAKEVEVVEENDMRDANPKLDAFLRDNFTDDNREENENAAMLCMEPLVKTFKMDFTDRFTVIAFYTVVFNAINKVILEKRNEFTEYKVNICDRFEIGYTDSKEEDGEKIGSFNPFMVALDNEPKTFVPIGTSTVERCAQWVTENVVEQKAILTKIAVEATKDLKELVGLNLPESGDCIFGPFCLIHDNIIQSYIKDYEMQYDENDFNTYSLDFNVMASAYNLRIRKSTDNDLVVEFRPNVSMKQAVKNDGTACKDTE